MASLSVTAKLLLCDLVIMYQVMQTSLLENKAENVDTR